jgi:hypothetical protein
MGDREPPAAPGRRVLQVIDSLARAGAEQSLVALAPHLVVGGVDLHVAYLVERDDLRPELERIGVPVTSLTPPDGRRHRQWWYHRLRELIAAVGPDVVHTTLFEAGAPPPTRACPACPAWSTRPTTRGRRAGTG